MLASDTGWDARVLGHLLALDWYLCMALAWGRLVLYGLHAGTGVMLPYRLEACAMKLQSKPVLAGVIPDKTTRKRGGAGEPTKPGSLNIPVGNLQALASELHQSATQGLFEYPRNWVLTARVVAFMFITLGLLRLLLVV